MKKCYQKMLSVILSLSILSAILVVPVSASNVRQGADWLRQTAEKTVDIEDHSLAEYAALLNNDPLVKSVNFDGARLSYTMEDGTFAILSEAVSSDGTRTWIINQQGMIDKLEVNAQRNELVLNDMPLRMERSEVQIVSKNTVQNRSSAVNGTVWYAMGNGSQYHIQLEQKIRSITSSLLHALMFSALGTIGVGLGVAQLIISAAIAYNSNSTALFVKRRMYRDYNYLQYRYVDNYYFDRYYTDWAHCEETIVLSAN